jgi:hypothetical protein
MEQALLNPDEKKNPDELLATVTRRCQNKWTLLL